LLLKSLTRVKLGCPL